MKYYSPPRFRGLVLAMRVVNLRAEEEAAATLATIARARALPIIRQVPLWPVAAAGTAVTAAARVSVLSASGIVREQTSVATNQGSRLYLVQCFTLSVC